MSTFEYIQFRPAEDDPKRAIGERKPVYADSLEKARQIVKKMPAVLIGGKSYNPTLIEPKR